MNHEDWVEPQIEESKDGLRSKLTDAAMDCVELVTEKNAAYGDSFGQSGKILQILYPGGIRPGQYPDLLALVRVIDKLFRIATDKKAFGEDPWKDVMGYALLSAERK